MKDFHPYQTLLAIIGNVFDAHAAALFLPDHENREQLRLVASWCPNTETLENICIEEGQGYVGVVMRNAAPLLIEHTDIQQNNLNYYGAVKPDVQTFYATLVANKGVLVIDSLEKDVFKEEDQTLLALFARLIPQIQNITALTTLSLQLSTYFYALEGFNILREKYTSWSEYLHSSLKILSEASGFEYVSFASRPEESNTYLVECENVPLILKDNQSEEISLQSGMLGWVLRNEEAIYNDGVNRASSLIYGKIAGIPDFKSAICLPLQFEKNTFGAICLASRSKSNITPELKSFLKIATGNISQILEKVYMQHQLNYFYRNQ